jgi:MFS family permease
VLAAAAVMGAAMPLMLVAFMTLIQRRTPQAIMGRVSAAVEVVMGVPQAISLAVGSLLVVILSYRTILAIMGAVTLVAAAYIVTMLRDHIATDLHRPPDGDVEPHEATLDTGLEILPASPMEP